MELNFHVTGSERKRLVTAMAEFLHCEVQYLGVPSCAYRVGDFLVEKTGVIRFEDSVDDNLLRQLTQKLEQEGFSADAATGLAIQMPMPNHTALANLYALVEAKSNLIKKALGVEDLSIRRLEDRLEFPWFPADAEPEEVKTYLHFVTALCDLAKSQKRVSSREKPVENEKYAFRCFLLRLGFIGSEFKAERKILLRNLTGSSAFKCGKKEADHDVSQ